VRGRPPSLPSLQDVFGNSHSPFLCWGRYEDQGVAQWGALCPECARPRVPSPALHKVMMINKSEEVERVGMGEVSPEGQLLSAGPSWSPNT
jgi:hypothetical protein